MIKILYIIGGIAYFLFTVYRKNKQKQEAERAENPNVAESESWGMEDLISQFENKYGVETQEEYSGVEDEYNYVDEVVEDQTKATSVNMPFNADHSPEENPNYWEETANHHAFKEEKVKLKSNVGHYGEQAEDEYEEFDLRNIVISSAVLNRPEY